MLMRIVRVNQLAYDPGPLCFMHKLVSATGIEPVTSIASLHKGARGLPQLSLDIEWYAMQDFYLHL